MLHKGHFGLLTVVREIHKISNTAREERSGRRSLSGVRLDTAIPVSKHHEHGNYLCRHMRQTRT
jgi:hypothetical protein